ncbi:MAG TPA: A/G-specific adenine glycosylase, partial [Thermopetrobacter sp.]|nr:A/G-specific adenine glycosylase [Thermopetrobacter sp.]
MNSITAQLLAWYDAHRRDLPWRAPPGARPDPYHVWLSEIMLQQTTVATVRRRFPAFVARWPDVRALAATPLEEVLAAWAGLGYYARARNLHACARVVAERMGGRFPASVEALRRLPGIGPYTAAAVASIAFGVPVAALDANLERVMARLFAIDTPLPAGKREIAEAARALIPKERPGDFNQAAMDLGATVCRARNPQCDACPLRAHCLAHRRGIATTLPRKAAKKPKPV